MPIIEYKFIKTVIINTDTNEVISSIDTVETKDTVLPIVNTVRKSTKKVEIKNEDDDTKPIVKLQDNKLILNNSALSAIEAQVGDRISINYINKKDTNIFYPVISKSSVFGDNQAGNKLTKSNTVSFKGKQYNNLSQYGSEFELIISDDVSSKIVYMLKDFNHKEIETISDDEMINIEIKQPDTIDIDLKTSNDEFNIDYDFNFDNLL